MALGDLGRQLTAKVALLVGDRVGVDFAEELRQHLKRIGQHCLQLGGDGLRARLEAAQVLLGHTDLLAQVRE